MRQTFALAATLLIVAPTFCAPAFALNPNLDVSQYAHNTLRTREGFLKSEITAFAQTPDGYLWLGTEFGLYRFDGVRAVRLQPPGDRNLPSDFIKSLLVSRDGTLWVGTWKGLASWKNGRLTQYPELAGEDIFKLVEDREGTVWAGDLRAPTVGRLCAIRNTGVDCIGRNGELGSGVYGLHEDARGNLWVGANDGIWNWKPGPRKFYPLPGSTNGIQNITADSEGNLLFIRNHRIYRLSNGKTEPYPLPDNAKNLTVHTFLSDRDGGLWIGSESGLAHLYQGRADVFTQADGLSGNQVHAIFEDREGDIWVSTYGGLDRFYDTAVAAFTEKQGLPASLTSSVLADRDGGMWLATFGGLERRQNGQIFPFDRRQGKLNGSSPTSLFQDRSGRIWVSTPIEIGYIRDDRFVLAATFPSDSVHGFAQDARGDVWAASQGQGLIEFVGDRLAGKTTWEALGIRDLAAPLAADPARDGLWLGYYRGGVAFFADGKVQKLYSTADGLGAGRINQLRMDTDGTLWAATEGGLSRLKNERFATLSAKNGLPCDAVQWSIEDKDHSLWLMMRCGLARIARPEVEAFAAAVDKDPAAKPTLHPTVFDESDGARMRGSASAYVPQVSELPNGEIWFATLDGVSVIDPHHLAFNKLPPPVHVEEVTADGQTYDAANGLHLPPHVRDLSIDYTALSLVVPEKVHFKVKLEGQDNDWRELVNVRHVEYTNLPPRRYTFRVLACNNSGVWNETGASLEFSIAPAYYQTLWFRFLCAVAFVALLWALYQLRLHQMRQQFAAGLEGRVSERLRIARELHDTLLQSLQGVSFQLHAVRKLLLRKADNASEVLDEAILATEDAIREGRSTIHDLRPEPAAQRDLPQLLNDVGHEQMTAHETSVHSPSYRVVIEGKQQNLSPMLQDEVYRITREVIRNAFAHAAASHIEVEIRYDQNQLRLRVRDDGKGIDPKVLEAGGQSGHFGIPGMRERAQRIGSQLEFWSEVGAGTEVQLTVPASMAYQKQRDGRRFPFFRRAGGDEQRS